MNPQIKVGGKKIKKWFQNSKINDYRRWYYLTVAFLSFTIFVLTLPKGSTIAQSQLTDPAANLIRENDTFAKVTPDDLKMTFPVYTPPPKGHDYRLVILQKYLSEFNSPLKDHAQDFLDASDNYGVDWRLVPAIAGVESTFGKSIPGGQDPKSSSYNGWGWGIYGTHMIKFSSWRQAIFAVTKGLKDNYINKGLTDPVAINKKYASDPEWGSTVTYFLNDIDSFANNNKDPNALTLPDDTSSQIFQNYVYLKDQDNTHFSLQTAE